MSALLVEQAPAKINLILRVIGRRADGYHELESLVAFADVADVLTLQLGEAVALDISGPYASGCGKPVDNLVLKAHAALHERVPALRGGCFVLEKNLPVAAGIGGGSADAAAALRLLARANALAFDDPRLFSAARAVGADVPVCLEPKTRIMGGIGELLSSPITMPSLPCLLVNPGVPTATRDVFNRWSEGEKASQALAGPRQSVLHESLSQQSIADEPLSQDSTPQYAGELIAFLNKYCNDLTPAAIACTKVIDDVLNTLRALPNASLVRMSGSGSTCFALFTSTNAAMSAARALKVEHPNWWICATKIG